MDFKEFFIHRTNELDINYTEVARDLTLNGYNVTKQAVNAWVKTNRKPDILNATHRRALCRVLKVDEASLLSLFGIDVEQKKSPYAMYIADMVNQYPEDKQKVLVSIIEDILKVRA